MLELIHYLEQIDTTIFLFFNGMHNELFDYFMVLVSNRFTWVPFYAAFIFVMIKNFHWKVTIVTILAIALLVLLCDQTASGLLKPLVRRLRPSNLDNSISYMVHVVDGYRGGRYGFPSSHSANSWGSSHIRHVSGKKQKAEYIPGVLGCTGNIFSCLSGSTLSWRFAGRSSYWLRYGIDCILCL